MYESYARDVDLPVTDSVTRTVWRWIMDGTHHVECLIAENEGGVTGFATFRPFPRTLDGNEACYLDDLYVRPEFRGTGVVRALLERLVALTRERGWSHVRWVTTPDNARARGLYDKVAELTDLITYRIDVQ
jgi:ribosomal protein S18 acetylase RimI-like enzyme